MNRVDFQENKNIFYFYLLDDQDCDYVEAIQCWVDIYIYIKKSINYII